MGAFLIEKELTSLVESYKSFIIIPDTALDSLLATGVLLKALAEHGWDVRVSLDAKTLIDYPSDPAILLNLPPQSKDKQVAVYSSQEGSVTAKIVLLVEHMFGSDKWSKMLAILAGLYRKYYNFKEGGFKGVENGIFNELSQSRLVTEAPALRVWGAKRKNLVAALTRTLMPIIPGVTGVPDKARKIVESVFKDQDAYLVKEKEIKGDEKSKSLLKSLLDSMGSSSAVMDLLGDFYMLLPRGSVELEASEVLGSLVVYESLCEKCPLNIVLVPLDEQRVSQVISIYDEVIDQLVMVVAGQVDLAKRGEPIETEGLFERPELVIDTLAYINALPRDRPVSIIRGDGRVTALRELIRVGVDPKRAYVECEPSQLCTLR